MWRLRFCPCVFYCKAFWSIGELFQGGKKKNFTHYARLLFGGKHWEAGALLPIKNVWLKTPIKNKYLQLNPGSYSPSIRTTSYHQKHASVKWSENLTGVISSRVKVNQDTMYGVYSSGLPLPMRFAKDDGTGLTDWLPTSPIVGDFPPLTCFCLSIVNLISIKSYFHLRIIKYLMCFKTD